MVSEEEREEEEVEEIVLQKRGARPLSETDFFEKRRKEGLVCVPLREKTQCTTISAQAFEKQTTVSFPSLSRGL